jgi:hypothetical protein
MMVRGTRVILMRTKSSSKPVMPIDRPDLVDHVLASVQVFKEAITGDVERRASTVVEEVLRDVVLSSPKAPSQEVQTVARSSIFTRAPKRKRDKRQSVEATALENAITTAVKNGVSGGKGFVGVFVKRLTPKSRFDANWAIRGVRFGSTDRDTVNKALVNIVGRMQADFRLSDDKAD